MGSRNWSRARFDKLTALSQVEGKAPRREMKKRRGTARRAPTFVNARLQPLIVRCLPLQR